MHTNEVKVVDSIFSFVFFLFSAFTGDRSTQYESTLLNIFFYSRAAGGGYYCTHYIPRGFVDGWGVSWLFEMNKKNGGSVVLLTERASMVR